ncbi:MAG: PQQ-binding-like beta-propeller repeat protein, partial [Elusimicrobiota bacterium]
MKEIKAWISKKNNALGILIMSLCGSIHSLQAADWPAFQFDSQRNAYNAEETIHVPLHSSWTFETGSSAFGFASAILSSDRIFAGSPSGRLSAFDRNTSSAAWSAELGGAIYLAPALAGSSLIAASAQGMVYSFNTADGAVLWSHPIGSGVNASPAIRDGVAFIVSNAGKLLALDVANGTLRWSADLGGDYAWSSPAVDALRVYVAAQGGKVFAFDRQSGALLWSCAFPGPIRATPAADGDTLFLGSHDGSFRALSTADGSLRWNHPIGAPVFGGVAVSSQTVYCAALDGSVYALSKADGSLLWKHATGDKIYSSPSLVQGALLIGSNDKNLYALDPQTGTPLWQSALDGRVSAAPAISRGWVMVMTDAGTLHAFNSPNQPPSVPSELAVNSSTNAVLNTSSVAFSWSFTDPDPADAQTAFTLRLSSVAGSWDAPAFDTGRVDSSFPAFLLSASLPDGRYFWQVRVFDTFGEPSPFSAGADSFIWDHAVPVVSIASPVAGGTFLPGHMLEVSFSASDTLDSAPVVSATLVQIQDLGRPRGEQPARVPVLSGAVLDPATLDDGLWLLEISATDSAGNSTTTVSGAFSILHDMAPPRTTFAMGAPQAAGGPDGSIFVTRQTSFTLSALDDLISADGIGLGVASLRLNVDGIQRLLAQNPAPAQGQAFNSSLMLETDPDGLHLLSYFAQDILQNAESIHFSTVAVDNTAPQTTLALSGGQQANVGSEFYASSGTYFSLSALDPETNGVASGLSSTHFQDNNSGLQAYASPFALAEGSHTLTYQSADRLGNLEVLRSSTVFVDAAAPSLSLVPVNGSTLTVAIPQIVASYADARPGINLNSVRMTLDNVDVTAQSAMTETSASFTPATPLAQGLHIITAVVADLVGNAASLNSTFFIDSLTPVTTLTIGTPSFSSGTVFVTNATLLGLSASEPAQISYKVDSASFTTFTAPFTLTGDGPHSIAFFSVDTAGNTESINIRSLTVDATPPSTDLLVNGQVSDATSLVLISTDVLAFAADDAGAGVAATLIALDGAAPAPFTTAFSLTQGTHTLAFHSRDNLDNQELEHAVAITVLSPDSTPPSLSILPVNGSTLTVAIPQIVASYADAQSGIDPSSVRLILDGVDVTAQAFVTDVSASLTPATALAQGAHTVTASVQDTAGNAASAKSAFLIDSQAPVIAITSPAAGAILNSTSAILTATYADAGTGLLPVSIRLLLDETVLPAQLRWTGGGEPTTWQSSVPLPEGLFSMGVVEAGGRVYVAGGGVAGQIRSSVYFASILPDGRLGPWTATTPLPQVNMRVNLIHAQGRIYVLGGAGYGGGFAASYYADVQADGSLGAWTPLPNMPWGARSGFGAVLLSGRVYVYGGYTEDCATHAEAYYAVPCSQGLCHPQTGLSDAPWLATTAMAQDLAFFGAAGMGNRVYAAGGTRGCGQSSRSEVWYSEAGPDGALGAWQQTAQLPQGFANPRMAASDGTFYVMGGNDVSGELSA